MRNSTGDLERRHRASQLIGLARREAGTDDGHLHRLLLKQRHAQRLTEDPSKTSVTTSRRVCADARSARRACADRTGGDGGPPRSSNGTRTDIDILRRMKVDVLEGTLGCMRRAFDLLRERRGEGLDLASASTEDPATYAMIRRARTRPACSRSNARADGDVTPAEAADLLLSGHRRRRSCLHVVVACSVRVMLFTWWWSSSRTLRTYRSVGNRQQPFPVPQGPGDGVTRQSGPDHREAGTSQKVAGPMGRHEGIPVPTRSFR